MNVVIAIASIYLIWLGALMSTKNMMSAIIFRAIPFFLGSGLAIITLKNYGII